MEDYKEKLRLAKEALDSGSYDKETIEYIFPELKESEDEKIRKEIIQSIQDNMCVIHKEKCIAWLEKQGTDKDTLFKIATILSQYEDKEDSPLEKIRSIMIDDAICSMDLGCKNKKQGEQKPNDKVEPKFKVGDIIKPKDGGHEPWQVMQVDVSDKKYRFKDGYAINFSQEDNYELVKQNSAWSEEDEKGLGDALWAIEQARTVAKDENDMGNLWYAEKWLKSLKERYAWKPSDEQMEVLNWCKPLWNEPKTKAVLESLIEDLKKLREE